jgi:hypothetical protein
VHLDTVVGLGTFLELEVVLRPNQTPVDGHEIAEDLMSRLGILESDLVTTAYADMLIASTAEQSASPSPPLTSPTGCHTAPALVHQQAPYQPTRSPRHLALRGSSEM